MHHNEKLAETLNDLVRINNDRITGYEKAAEQAESIDVDLKVIFNKMASESREYIRQLDEKVIALGEKPSADSTFAGKIYRTWMDVKNTFTGSDRTSILNSCEFGEDAAQKAYNEALESDAEMDADTRQLIMEQKNSLKNSHDIIKKYRDLNKAAD